MITSVLHRSHMLTVRQGSETLQVFSPGPLGLDKVKMDEHTVHKYRIVA